MTEGCEGIYRGVELRRHRISAAGAACAVNAGQPALVIEHRAAGEPFVDGQLGVFEQTRV